MRMFFKYIVVFSMLLCAASAVAQTAAELKKRKAQTEKEIENINQKLSQTKAEKSSTTQQIALLNQRIDQRKKLIRNTNVQVSMTENEISQKQGNISQIKRQLAKMKDYYSELLVSIYMKRKKANWMMYIFASEDLGQAYRRLKYMQSYTDVVFSQANKIKKTSQQLNSEIAVLNDKKQELNLYKAARERDVQKLSVDESEAQKALQGLKKNEAELRRQIQKKRTVLANLNAQISKMLTKEVKKSNSSGFSKTPVNVKLSKDFASNRGRLPWPVRKGNITGFFGRHMHPVFKLIELPPNNGVDISTNTGEPVLSVFSGVVRSVFSVPGMNVCIMIQHGEYYTVYARLSNASVGVGDNVKTGTTLGKVAAGSDDSQLHFELWKGTTKLNPELWLQKK